MLLLPFLVTVQIAEPNSEAERNVQLLFCSGISTDWTLGKSLHSAAMVLSVTKELLPCKWNSYVATLSAFSAPLAAAEEEMWVWPTLSRN